MTALDELVAEGWLVAERGRGYRVVGELPTAFTRVAPISDKSSETYQWVVSAPPLDAKPRPSLRWSFPSGQPDLRLFPKDEYFAEVRTVLRTVSPDMLLGYQAPGGCDEIVEALALYLRRVRGVTGGEVVVTHGSQEAIYLLARLLVKPGQTVCVEALGYPPALAALRTAGAKLVGVPIDSEGLRTDVLETALARERVALIYLTPLHQYPTTVTMSMARRADLYRLAQKYDVPILEDDYDHEFHYRSRPVPPLKSRDPDGRIAYVSTFSKILYPAARLGFAVVPPGVAEPLRAMKRIVSRQNDTVTERAVAAWLSHGGLERHLRRMRRVYAHRLSVMADALEAAHVPFTRPDGGMSLWVDFGVPSVQLSQAAAALDVHIQDSRFYRVDGKDSTSVRIGFASSTPEEIAAGVDRLVRASVKSAARR
jgi:GntR family transcriptional regulator/MocR family aminotransferase